MLLKIFTYNTL